MRTKRSRQRHIALEDILHFGGTVRLPVSGSVQIADEVRQVIDTPAFQRLRGVRQLGPTHFVYPGAIHTRFEHSLGTYALSLRYVRALLVGDEIYHFPQPVRAMAKVLIAAALLHDIGHYPFSHLIEEIGIIKGIELARHEERAEHIILQESGIAEILRTHWDLNPRDVCNVITGKGLTGGFAVMASALDSVLDLDKMDYLMRDSVHCGVSFGLALDTGRFLSGLRIDKNNACIGLTTKAESYIPTLLALRNLMYNEVYWHKTVRVCSAMLKKLFYRLAETSSLDTDTVQELIRQQDDRVALHLYELAVKTRDKTMIALAEPFTFGSRSLYKLVYHYGTSVASEKPHAKQFFSAVIGKQQASLVDCIALAQRLEVALRHLCPKLQSGDILLEDTPVKPGHEIFDLERLRLFDEKTGDYVDSTYELGFVEHLLSKRRRVFVFCHPDRAFYCRRLTGRQWERVFHRAVAGHHNLESGSETTLASSKELARPTTT